MLFDVPAIFESNRFNFPFIIRMSTMQSDADGMEEIKKGEKRKLDTYNFEMCLLHVNVNKFNQLIINKK